MNKDNISTVTKQYGSIISGATPIFNSYRVVMNDNKEYVVPLDPAYTDYQAIEEWIADGNSVIDPNAD